MALLVAALAAFAPGAATADEPVTPQSGQKLGDGRHIVLEPFAVTVFRDERVRGLLALDLTLELSKAERRAAVEQVMPRLRDRYLTALMQFASNRVDVTRPVELEALTALLQAVTDEALGRAVARVLIGGAMVRKF